tara:strand:- start:1736 stop:2140 length:405 start_codon:yes stop_codon:yes gene_type:complete
MHAANQRPAGDAAKVALKFTVALFVCEMLLVPIGERMAGNGQRRQPMPLCYPGYGRAKPRQISAGFGNGFADPRADLDLALKKLGTDLIFEFGDTISHESIGCGDEIQGLAINEQIFFFDTKGKAGLMMAHKRI